MPLAAEDGTSLFNRVGSAPRLDKAAERYSRGPLAAGNQA